MKLSSAKLKKFLIFSAKKYFRIFRDMKLPSPELKGLLIFQEGTFQN